MSTHVDHQHNKEAALTKRIMRRVYLVWGLRMIVNPRFLKSLMMLLFVIRSTQYISYAHVIANAPSLTDIPRSITFLSDALRHTGLMSATLLFGILIVSLWLIADVVRHRQPEYFF